MTVAGAIRMPGPHVGPDPRDARGRPDGEEAAELAQASTREVGSTPTGPTSRLVR